MILASISRKKETSHILTVFEAIFVTILWSSSWVLIKIGLKEIPPLTFAGVRYFLAFLILFFFVLSSPKHMSLIRGLSSSDFVRILCLGLLFYSVTQGSIFIGLALLPTITVSLLLNFTSFIVVFLGMWYLLEVPRIFQWIGLACFFIGISIYFYPIIIPKDQGVGLIIVIIGIFANAGSSILGRYINRRKNISPIIVTTISMGLGSILLLISGISIYGFPRLSLSHWVIILWLAVINTAIAFTLWNHTLRTLTALESSIINNTMLFQIALLAWIFLHEKMNNKTILGIIIAGAGAILVQLRKPGIKKVTSQGCSHRDSS